MKLKYQLPEIYKNILPSEFLSFDPQEKKATCDRCAMAKENGHRRPKFYQPDLKCCTFEPFLPNFMVGAIFSEPGFAEAQETFRDKIQRREYMLPIGSVAPVRYQLEFKAQKEKFGNLESMLCSHYDRDSGRCRIWRYRGVVCTSFHCKSSYGKEGLRFWDQTSDLLSYVEQALLEEVLIQLDFSPRQVSELTSYLNRSSGTVAEKKSWVLPESKCRELWNGYFDDQEGFYKKSFAIASQMQQKDFLEMIGETGAEVLEKTLIKLRKIKKLQEDYE